MRDEPGIPQPHPTTSWSQRFTCILDEDVRRQRAGPWSKVRVKGQRWGALHSRCHLCSPDQYRELQACAQLHGNSMKETKVQITQLQQTIKKLQSQIETVKNQVRVLSPQALRLTTFVQRSLRGWCETLITHWNFV